MPLDGHAFLVSQGWAGKGTGLRQGAIARPITIAQKKTLSGIGKDRDDAFPFWDHVFQAAAVNIQIKLQKDSDEDDSDSGDTPERVVELERTNTGIISHCRPKCGTPALSGTSTLPHRASSSGGSTPRLTVMALAKQEAARRMLYANFFRGPVIGSHVDDLDSKSAVEEASRTEETIQIIAFPAEREKKLEKRKAKDLIGQSEKKEKERRKKSKGDDGDEDKRESKRRKRELGKKEHGKKEPDKAETEQSIQTREAKLIGRAEKKRRKEEKRARREERRRLKGKANEEAVDEMEALMAEEGSESPPENVTGPLQLAAADSAHVEQKKKKKRSCSDNEKFEKKTKKRKETTP